MKKFKTGIQLYTLRNALQEDFKGTLKSVKEMGFDGVEFAGNYGNMLPEELAAFLKEIGLKACGLHVSVATLTDPQSQPYAYAKALGCRYVTTSLQNLFPDAVIEAINSSTLAGKVAKDKGLVFTYHNHAQELQKSNNEYALASFYAATSPATVMAELDTFWLAKGGVNPTEWVKTYADRLPQLHLKDMDKESGTFAPLGTGCLDFPAIIAEAQKGITEWLIYEQDSCTGNPLDAARISIAYLKKIIGR